MTTNRRSAGGLPFGTTAPTRWARPPGFALVALALFGLAQAGCQSGGCSTCGLRGIGTKLTNGVQALGSRVFHHGARGYEGGVAGGGCCGGVGSETDGVYLDSGVPMPSGGMVVPGNLIPAPVESSPPTELRPLDDNRANPTSTGATSTPAQSRNQPTGINRSAYEANRRSPSARTRSGEVARAMHTPPAPGGLAADLLDNMPPVDLPTEVTNKAVAPATALPASAPVEPAPASALSPAAENHSATEAGPIVTLPTIAAPVGHGATPGIVRCNSVEPHLMGGSLPTAEGLDWLSQRGYKTFLDLRSRAEVDPTFVDSVYDRGMVYVALPILANRLDASRLARFDDLVSQADNRPLYFCDADGTRAGLAWYIHRLTVDHYDPQTAAQEAGEMGLLVSSRKDADTYVATRGGPARPEAAPAPLPATIPTEPRPAKSAAVELPPSALPTAMTARVDPEATPQASEPSTEFDPAPALEAEGGDVMKPQASSPPREVFHDPMAWKPIAALVLAGVGVPLAYWSRSAVSLSRSHRASRPAKGRKSLEARPASDA